MNKFAYAGQLYALNQLGLIPQESLEGVNPYVELLGGGNIAPQGYQGMFPGGFEHSVYSGTPAEPKRDWWKTIRKAGPAIGATLGGLAGLLLKKRLGGAGRGLLEGGATGGFLGWLPDVYGSAAEAVTESPNKPTA